MEVWVCSRLKSVSLCLSVIHVSVCLNMLMLCNQAWCSGEPSRAKVLSKTKNKKVEGCHLLLQEVRVLEVEKELQLVQQERDVLLQQVDILKM